MPRHDASTGAAGAGNDAHMTLLPIVLLVATAHVAQLAVTAAPVVDTAATDPAAGTLEIFAALPKDPEPAAITRGQHYWIGNEDRLDLFYTAIKDKGGIHMGVGAEQNWLLCGWSRCRVAVFMDFDQAIVDLHHVYIAAFATAPTRAAFLKLWLDKKRKDLRAAVITRYSGAQALGALKALDVARWSVERRFGRLTTQTAAHGLPSFLTSDADYAWLHELARDGRAFAVRGDLTAKKTVLAIAAAATTAALPVRSLYMSNAEQYFTYNKQTRMNLSSLPMDDESVVLRTHGSNALGYAAAGNAYHYGVQTGPSFKAFVAEPTVTSSHQILQWAAVGSEPGTSTMTSTTPKAARSAWLATKPATKKKPKPKTAATTPATTPATTTP